LQQAYVERATEILSQDRRVAGAWMKGSLATGAAGRYSDVDLGVAVYDELYDTFIADREKVLSQIGPLVGMGGASVGPRVTVALFADPVEFDLTADPLSATEMYGPEIGWVLFDKTDGQIAAAQAQARRKPQLDLQRAHEIVVSFWLRAPRMRRWVAQADLHRAGKELQVARNWLVELMLIANQPFKTHTIQKDTFILLSPRQWGELKTTYILTDFTPRAVARCMIHLAYAINKWGRAACARQGSDYPVELERVSARAIFEFYETVFGSFGENGHERRAE
jgi:hypothetical protein